MTERGDHYTTLKGEVLALDEPDERERAHIDRVMELYRAGRFGELIHIHKGAENPLAREDERGTYFEDDDLERVSWKLAKISSGARRFW